jgi:ubiquinone/menaquinone biosynthesis C-methylase UbiE
MDDPLPRKRSFSIFYGILRPVYHLLYHTFAWTYDGAAWIVSLGKWNQWIQICLPLVKGPRILELGFGPGHLQENLLERGEKPFGIDESRQMARQAYRRITGVHLRKKTQSNDYANFSGLIRGVAQHLPFPVSSFSSIVATFPAPYIFYPDTLQEVYRVLIPGGKLIILYTAWFTEEIWYGRWILRVFPFARVHPESYPRIEQFFQNVPFHLEIHTLPGKNSSALVITASKPPAKDDPVGGREILRRNP